jgi:predicted transcriptional regulator
VTLVIRKDLVRRLDRIASRAGLSTTALANLFLEAAVNEEERWLARDQRVIKELEAILVHAILNGDDDGNAAERPRRHRTPPGE